MNVFISTKKYGNQGSLLNTTKAGGFNVTCLTLRLEAFKPHAYLPMRSVN